MALLDKMVAEKEDAELITLYYGNDLSEAEASQLADAVSEHFEDLDVEVFSGGQPLYYFLISID